MANTIFMIHSMWGTSEDWDKYRTLASYRESGHQAHWLLGEPGWQEVGAYPAHSLSQPGSKTVSEKRLP